MRLTLAKKLTLGFGAVVAVIVAVVLLNVVQVGKAQQRTQRVVNLRVRTAQASAPCDPNNWRPGEGYSASIRQGVRYQVQQKERKQW